MEQRLLLVADGDVARVGGYFQQAAQELGLSVRFCDMREAYRGAPGLQKWNWWVRGHRPTRLTVFSRQLLEGARAFRPSWMLTTGIAPVDSSTLKILGQMGIQRLNFLTDDPWNPAHRAPWFMDGLVLYDHLFSPRKANLEQLKAAGCAKVSYLPFAYNPSSHFPESPWTDEERRHHQADLIFAGAADSERIRFFVELIRAGFDVRLYGAYWNRHPLTGRQARPFADPRTLRLAVSGAKVALVLVRRANRDDNAMRTFEVPAMGGCLLAEDTPTHREIFGPEAEAAVYFRSVEQMIKKVRWLLDNEKERRRLVQMAHRLILQGRHTYRDRLKTMLGKGS